MVFPIPYGGHNKLELILLHLCRTLVQHRSIMEHIYRSIKVAQLFTRMQLSLNDTETHC